MVGAEAPPGNENSAGGASSLRGGSGSGSGAGGHGGASGSGSVAGGGYNGRVADAVHAMRMMNPGSDTESSESSMASLMREIRGFDSEGEESTGFDSDSGYAMGVPPRIFPVAEVAAGERARWSAMAMAMMVAGVEERRRAGAGAGRVSSRAFCCLLAFFLLLCYYRLFIFFFNFCCCKCALAV